MITHMGVLRACPDWIATACGLAMTATVYGLAMASLRAKRGNPESLAPGQ